MLDGKAYLSSIDGEEVDGAAGDHLVFVGPDGAAEGDGRLEPSLVIDDQRRRGVTSGS